MKPYLPGLILAAATLGASGCIVKETTHRLYLSPDGGVVWSVLERDARSDEADASKRWVEERNFLDALEADHHPIAEGFRRLNPQTVDTRRLRSDRPYTILSEARFDRVDRLADRLLAEFGVPGRVSLEQRGACSTLTLEIDLSVVDNAPDPETPAVALVEELDAYKIVLTHGRFVAASGFDIIKGGTVAVLKDQDLEPGGLLTLSLTWIADGR